MSITAQVGLLRDMIRWARLSCLENAPRSDDVYIREKDAEERASRRLEREEGQRGD